MEKSARNEGAGTRNELKAKNCNATVGPHTVAYHEPNCCAALTMQDTTEFKAATGTAFRQEILTPISSPSDSMRHGT